MWFPKFLMLLEQFYNAKFMRIQMVKELGKWHLGLYHWKDKHLFEQ
jgi:hypothetical protein